MQTKALDTSICVVIDSNVDINGAPKYMKKMTIMIITIKEDMEYVQGYNECMIE